MGSGIPERIGWAVETLAVKGDDCLLEVGCGRGIAIAQIAPLLTSGHVLAIDRSATAIAAAKALQEMGGGRESYIPALGAL